MEPFLHFHQQLEGPCMRGDGTEALKLIKQPYLWSQRSQRKRPVRIDDSYVITLYLFLERLEFFNEEQFCLREKRNINVGHVRVCSCMCACVCVHTCIADMCVCMCVFFNLVITYLNSLRSIPHTYKQSPSHTHTNTHTHLRIKALSTLCSIYWDFISRLTVKIRRKIQPVKWKQCV